MVRYVQLKVRKREDKEDKKEKANTSEDERRLKVLKA